MIADFEEVLFSGVPPENRPPIMWVQHMDKGRLELNYTTFNALKTAEPSNLLPQH
jgi:hypothetical protein